jgi:hypothetical protein
MRFMCLQLACVIAWVCSLGYFSFVIYGGEDGITIMMVLQGWGSIDAIDLEVP